MTGDKNNLDIFEGSGNTEFVNKLLPEVFMSTGDVQKFNPNNIIQSVSNETGLSYKDAKKVTELVVRRIIASGIKFLSGPHIRELVCSALSELKFENERKKFTRIGMPISDYENLMNSRFNNMAAEYTAPENIHRWAAGRLATEYTLLKLLDTEQTRSHLSGDIHIHSLRYFDMRPFAQSWDLRAILKYGLPPAGFLNSTVAKPAKHAITAIMHATKWLGFAHSEFSGGQNYLYFNTFIAPYLKGLDDKEIKQIAQMFIFETNQRYIAGGSHIPISSIITSPYVPNILRDLDAIGPGGKIVGKYGDFDSETLKFFNAISEIYTIGDGNGKLFAFPKHKVLVNNEWLNQDGLYDTILDETSTMGTPLFVNTESSSLDGCNYRGSFFSNSYVKDYMKAIGDENLFDWKENYLNMGALQSVSINLPRIAFEANGDDDKLDEILTKRMEIAKDILLIKYNVIKKLLDTKRLLLCSGIVDTGDSKFKILDLRRQALVFGYVGLNEMTKAFTGSQLHDNKEALEFGKKIINKMIDKCKFFTKDNNIFFTLWEQPAEFTTHRFATLDMTHFKTQAEKVVNGNIESKSVYYTPSAHMNYSANIELNDKINAHGQMSEILKNNSSLPLWLTNDSRNEDKNNLFSTIKNLTTKKINEFYFTHDFSLCPETKTFEKKLQIDCTEGTGKQISRITDYYTPLELWNKGKQQEFKDRKRIIL